MGKGIGENQAILVQGTLRPADLKTVSLEPKHAGPLRKRKIQQVSQRFCRCSRGSLYPGVHRAGAAWIDQGFVGMNGDGAASESFYSADAGRRTQFGAGTGELEPVVGGNQPGDGIELRERRLRLFDQLRLLVRSLSWARRRTAGARKANFHFHIEQQIEENIACRVRFHEDARGPPALRTFGIEVRVAGGVPGPSGGAS